MPIARKFWCSTCQAVRRAGDCPHPSMIIGTVESSLDVLADVCPVCKLVPRACCCHQKAREARQTIQAVQPTVTPPKVRFTREMLECAKDTSNSAKRLFRAQNIPDWIWCTSFGVKDFGAITEIPLKTENIEKILDTLNGWLQKPWTPVKRRPDIGPKQTAAGLDYVQYESDRHNGALVSVDVRLDALTQDLELKIFEGEIPETPIGAFDRTELIAVIMPITI